jgi:transcriptional regulator with XRE-family HTH domain
VRRSRFENNREFYAAVGRRIAARRNGRLTQEALATKTSLTRTSIINIEKGRQQILLHTLVDIANALQVSPIELIPETDSIENMLRDKPQKALDWIWEFAGSTFAHLSKTFSPSTRLPMDLSPWSGLRQPSESESRWTKSTTTCRVFCSGTNGTGAL